MAILWDLDLPVFVYSTVRIIGGRKRRSSQVPRALPINPEYQEIAEDALTQTQRDYLKPFDQQLAALNYQPDCTYRITNFKNLGKNLVRRYVNPGDSASCSLNIVELKVKVGDVEAVKTGAKVAFTTRFADGTLLTTRNLPVKTLLDQPPGRVVQDCPKATRIAELKRRHDAKAAPMGPAIAPVSGARAVFEEQRREHQTVAQYQVERGIYRLAPSGQEYELTDKAWHRGVLNHFNPFARRIVWPEVVLSALVGSVLPLLTIMVIAPQLRGHLEAAAPMIQFVTMVLIAVAYAFAGIIIGASSDWAPFYWIMLVSYVPTHVMAGWSFGWFPYTTTMFVFSFLTMQARRRRNLLFESGSEPS
jgi:hypothetical protein